METNYSIEFDSFTERHFIKNFRKKYKSRWEVTVADIVNICKHIDNMLRLKRADLISARGDYKLVKLDFAIEGERVSPKAAGNRCILFIDEAMRFVRVLLVYSKNDIKSRNETIWWMSLVPKEVKISCGIER